ncbi:MAG: hypothetical protein H6Q89_2133 [Myxococcaceae bacterium]|nr:hypothetical protein [Myxococcaceae bacterium]
MQTEQPEPEARRRDPLIEAQKGLVSEIMTRSVVLARPEMTVESAIGLMMENGLSRLPVVNSNERLVGIVSKTDLVTDLNERADTLELNRDWRSEVALSEQGLHVHEPGASVGDVMMPVTVSVNEHTPIARAAELMAVHHLHGLPVVSSQGEVIGVVSALDLAGWIAGLG